MIQRIRGRPQEPCDRGFGLVEIIISMLLLAILLAALAPLLANSILTTAKTTTIATATQLVNEGLDRTRLSIGSSGCSAPEVTAAGGNTTDNPVDARGVALSRVIRVSGDCSAGMLVDVTVQVSAQDETSFFAAGQPLAEATTRVFVP